MSQNNTDHSVAKKTRKYSHPRDELDAISAKIKHGLLSKEFAQHMDKIDPLRRLRDDFHYPSMKDLGSADVTIVPPDEDCVYFCGNSLGLCPRGAKAYFDQELDKWSKLGVYGHQRGDLAWAFCDERVDLDMAELVGGKHGEVALMNGLTVNAHVGMTSFYRPTPERHKILMESKAFPSDHYAVESQMRMQGYDPATSMICLEPREGEMLLHTEDILATIEKEGDSIALLFFSGVQYYTGQVFDMELITRAGHKMGCYVGWDLAHAVGNVEIRLHDWDVDWACWCTYKYLNTGAGGIAGFFIHEKHAKSELPRMLGWWSHDYDTRFLMENKMVLSPGAYGYRISNPPIMLICPLKASLDVFKKTSMAEIRQKSLLLTGYLEALIRMTFPTKQQKQIQNDLPAVDIITPADPKQRGAQLSLMFSIHIQRVYEELEKRGVVVDHRNPDVIRVAPNAMYCSFEDVYRFINYLLDAFKAAEES